MTDAVEILARLLEEDRSTLFVTGAGISADSGLPTYRGVGGLYEDASTDDGIAIEDALSGPMFRRNPALTWKYIRQIEEACRGAEPNRAHEVVAALEARMSRVVVLTQNVDGLHRRAGSQEVITIHGTVHDLHCTRCSWTDRVPDYAALPALPTCPDCSAVVRPNVVLFGEMLPPDGIARLEAELATGFDLVVSVGTSSLFPYIAAPVVIARQTGGIAFEINPGNTEVSRLATHRIRTGAAAALDAVGTSLGI